MRFAGGAPRDPLGWSPSTLHADAVHLNEKGYCNVAISDSYRAKFSCTVKKEDQTCYVAPSGGTGKSPSQGTSGAASLSVGVMGWLAPVALVVAAAQAN